MITKIMRNGVICFTILFSASTNATLIDITATSTNASLTDFTVRFDDTSGDGLLQVGEIVLFSGLTVTLAGALNGFYDNILGTPDLTGISTQSGNPSAANAWYVERQSDGLQIGFGDHEWTYSSSPAAIPEPGTFALLSLGLTGLGFTRLRMKR